MHKLHSLKKEDLKKKKKYLFLLIYGSTFENYKQNEREIYAKLKAESLHLLLFTLPHSYTV